MKILGVDIGNTSVKLSFGNGSELLSVAATEEAIGLCDAMGSDAVAYCSTRYLSDIETFKIREAGWWEFKTDIRLPLEIKYKTPCTLGPDRLAAAVGAWKLFPAEAVVIADLGTALTLDLVSERGEYLGGNISPGLGMRLEALHAFTSRLPLVDLEGEAPDVGYDTSTAIRAGAKWGVVAEIESLLRLASKRFGCHTVALTGGGAFLIEKELSTRLGEEAAVERVPSLVEEGLITAYEYNHDKKT